MAYVTCLAVQSVLRADAKPFISAALRRLFSGGPQPGRPGLAFLAAPHDLFWDVPTSKVHCCCAVFLKMVGAVMGYAG
jgi:hypothetical protein